MNKPLANDALTDNLRKAQTYLARFKSGPVPHRIAGESVTGAETFENYDPTDNSVLCNVSSGGAAEIDRAARAAEEAFKVWRAVPGEKR
ncbi:MAG: aldehyde dehydrogenase family protein, partial [Rhizobiales bacterium]|nr:aldehyde dehydrogenase family protein [Hyphomicrobiales bacterium]